jgi:endogenous inhibitor of DNA gyrase (YacG/DUF329 family)
MIEWIKGRELLDPPYNLSRRDIFKAVKDGILVPWEPQDDVPSERVLRVFPTSELQEEWYWQLQHKIWRLNGAREWLSKSDAEHIEIYKHDPVLQHLKDLETFINALPNKRKKYERITKEFPSQIKDLEKELAPNRVWKHLDLGPEQQESLIEKLLNAWYKQEEMASFLIFHTPTEPTQKVQQPIIPCKPSTKWKDITITLTSNDTVKIKTPEWDKPYSYHQLGLSDGRNSDKPTQLWDMLRIFCMCEGRISKEKIFITDLSQKKLTTRLNAKLKRIFGIKESIYMGHYNKEKEWRTKINFKAQLEVKCPQCKRIYNLKEHRECPWCSQTVSMGNVVDDRKEVEKLFDEANAMVDEDKRFEREYHGQDND